MTTTKKRVPKMENVPAPPKLKKETKPRKTKANPLQKTRAERSLEIIKVIRNQGLSLTKACEKSSLSRSEFHEEMDVNPILADEYERARIKRAEIFLDECVEIADDETQDKIPFYGAVKVKRDNLRIDSRLKYLSTMYPKKYGNKLELSGDKENPIAHVVLNLGSGVKPEEDE